MIAYEGGLAQGKYHGRGVAQYQDGSLYEGSWTHGKFSGRGSWFGADKQHYTGEWLQGVMCGEGKLRWEDLACYEGEFCDGWMEGSGRMETLGGLRYSGSWHRGKMHGEGVLEYPDSSVYSGGWLEGQWSGSGKLTWREGGVLEAVWEDGEPVGEASLELGALGLTGSLHDQVDVRLELAARLQMHAQLAQLRGQQPQPWAALFSTEPNPWCPYDQTARRIDAQLVSSMNEPAQATDEAVVLAKHLTDILRTAVHPFGVCIQIFATRFARQYQFEPDQSVCALEQLRASGVRALTEFLLAFKDYICRVLQACLTTRSRKLHAHAVLLDVVYPLVYPVLWSLYTEITRTNQARLDSTLERLSSASCAQLGVSAALCLESAAPAEASPTDKLVIRIPRSPEQHQHIPEDQINEFGVLIPPPSPSPLRSPQSPPASPTPNTPYAEAVAQLQLLGTLRTPSEKISCLKETSGALMSCIEHFHRASHKELTVGAEDKFPVMIFIVVQAKIQQLCAEMALLQDCLDERTRAGSESGYRVTELQAVVDHLLGLDLQPPPSSPADVQLELE